MDLSDVRVKIDALDDQLVDLFKKRMDLAMDVAKVKKSENLPILNTARERAIINRLTENVTDDMAGYIKILYTTLFDVSRAYQADYLYQTSEIGDKIKFFKVNVEEEHKLAQLYGIMSIPTLVLFKEGEEVLRLSGVRPKEALIAEIEKFAD